MSIGGCEDHLKPAPKMGESSAPSVVMVSDRTLLRCALADGLAAEGVTVLGEAEEDQRAISLVKQHKPEVFVVDLDAWGMGLTGSLAKLRELSPETLAVVVTSFDSPRQARRT
jgi:DNA-binding NarL/FixJ family response regulator